MEEANPHHELHARAQAVMPGGVSSPVRAWKAVGGTPLSLSSGNGAHVTDVKGARFFDFISSWGPLILGHAHPRVVEAVQAAAACGTSFGAPCEAECQLAEKVVALSPVADRVRFVNSGTEATMSALRLARAATGRDGFVKFDGCYHGHADPFLVQAGSGLATFGESSSMGVPSGASGDTGVLPLNQIEALDAWFQAHGAETAAVFVEGVPANCGLLPQSAAWWQHLRTLCIKYGSLLVVDEVITGFRLGPGGFCAQAGIEADLVTYGKVMGGGLPVGAYGGRADLMKLVSPEGGVYQAGTLSGNPLGMAAGLATLQVLEQEDGWARLEKLSAHWKGHLDALVAEEQAAGQASSVQQVGSIFWFCFGSDIPPSDFASISTEGADRYRSFFHALLEQQVMIAPSAYEVGFLSLAMEQEELDRVAEQFRVALRQSRTTSPAAS